ncbi:MAG TPA: dihydroneopterin aldolase [Mycobacteriales bacterium]|jgi:dihydroneopterin aldolase|nr:dihydroneopterin aldolase [Mycobacteriales bacterium]
MADRIALVGLRAFGYHGVLPQERREGQLFIVDATLSVDTRFAAASDDLVHTVDYAGLAQRLVGVVEGEAVNLIETLAQRLADVCLESDRVSEVEITVHKPDAPTGVAVADVTVTITRDRTTS